MLQYSKKNPFLTWQQLFGLQRTKWQPYLLTDLSEDDLDEDQCIKDVTFCTNVPSVQPVTVTQAPYSSSKWKIGILPNMIVECIINFTVSINTALNT